MTIPGRSNNVTKKRDEREQERAGERKPMRVIARYDRTGQRMTERAINDIYRRGK